MVVLVLVLAGQVGPTPLARGGPLVLRLPSGFRRSALVEVRPQETVVSSCP